MENIELEEDIEIKEDDNIEMEEETSKKLNNIITINHEQYELKYNLKTLKIIEKVIGKSLMAEMSKSNGMLSTNLRSSAGTSSTSS